MRRLSKIFLVLNLAIISLVSFVPVARMADPTPSGITVGPPLVEYTVEKGQTSNGVVRVNNYAPSPVTLYPMVQDFGAKNESGEPAILEADPNRKHSLSSWIKFSPEPMTLGVGEIQPVQYQIVVPSDAEPGGHYGVIFFSTKAPQDVKEGEAKIGANIKVGQLVLVTVPGAIKEQGSIASFKAGLFNFLPNIHFKKDGKWNLSWDWNVAITTRVSNSGSVHFKPQGKVTVKNLFGQKKAEFTVNEKNGNVLPDMVRRFDNTWTPQWWQVGVYKADLALTYGVDNNQLNDSEWMFIIPWWLVVVILVIVLWLIIRRLKRRRRKY